MHGAGMCARMNIAEFARKYPKVLDQLLRSLLELVCRYHAICSGCGPFHPEHATALQCCTVSCASCVACQEHYVAALWR